MITETHLGEIYDLIERSTKYERHLNEFERGFIEEWNSRLDAYGTRVNVSYKQQYILDKIRLKIDILEGEAGTSANDDGDRSRDLHAVDVREEVGGSCPGGQEQPGALDRS